MHCSPKWNPKLGWKWAGLAHRSCCCGCLYRQRLSPVLKAIPSPQGPAAAQGLWAHLECQEHLISSLTVNRSPRKSQPVSIGILVHGTKRIELEQRGSHPTRSEQDTVSPVPFSLPGASLGQAHCSELLDTGAPSWSSSVPPALELWAFGHHPADGGVRWLQG